MLEDLEDDGPTLAPYRGLAVSLAFGEGGLDQPFMLVVLEHADAGTAASNVERLKRVVGVGRSLYTGGPWSERLEIDTIETDGTRLVARLGIDPPSEWLRPVAGADSLLVHG